ncbi:MAG: DNA-3-methyladenine glycosylase [Acidimicrobiales bacterium]
MDVDSPLSAGRPLTEAEFARSAAELAPALVGAVLVHGPVTARIVEVEAYDPHDPASHSFIGPRPRTRAMFGPPGRLYVYRSYGLHWCANVVCSPDGVGAAVLLRAAEPLTGIELMFTRRPTAHHERELCAGPGRLCSALGLNGDHDGADLLDPDSPVRLLGSSTPGGELVCTTRVGITKAPTEPLRWYERHSRHISRR